jgi:hypothetical protein
MFYKHVIDETEKVGIILSHSYAYEGGFRHTYDLKPELRFTGVYNLNNYTYKLDGLSSKECLPCQEEWTPEEVEAIKKIVHVYKFNYK